MIEMSWKNITPTYLEIALEFESHLANLDDGYEKRTTTMSKEGGQWHKKVEVVINKITKNRYQPNKKNPQRYFTETLNRN